MKGMNKAPDRGVAIFAGFHMVNPGIYEWVFYAVIPPLPINTFKYICDTRFHTEYLEEMTKASDAYGIVVIERGEAVIALLRGSHWEIIEKVEFFVPGKHSAGGQSAMRFKRQTEHLAETFYKLVAEKVNKIFAEMPNLKGLVIAGPGPTKEEFLEVAELDHRIRNKIVAIVPACCADASGVMEAIKNAEDRLKESEYVRAKRAVDEVMYLAVKRPDYIVYGKENVLESIRKGIARKVVVSEDVGEDEIISLTIMAKERGIEVIVVPRSIGENLMIRDTFGGYVAILGSPSWIVTGYDEYKFE